MIVEVNEIQFQKKLKEHSKVVAFFHTPFCATCTISRHMLEKVLEHVKQTEEEFAAVSCDLNRMPTLAEPLQIMTVPIVLLFSDGEPIARSVAFGRADELYTVIMNVLNS